MPEQPGIEPVGPLLILLPTGRDADSAAMLLRREQILCEICPDLQALCDNLADNVGAVLVADEALAPRGLGVVAQHIAAQPPWSDLPFIVLTRSGAVARQSLVELRLPDMLGNVVVLERPLNAFALISAVRSALRARRRQRQVSVHLAERERAATALAESEARFRHMADSAPALIWMTDAEGHVVFANMHYEHMFGRPAADMSGDGWKEIVLPEDLERHTTAFLEAFHARAPFKIETRVRDRHSQVRWLRCEGVPRLDDAGRFLGYTGCNVDITEARLATDELESRVTHRTSELTQALAALRVEVAERERAEALLRQAQKMEAIGQLTGGIAHDFNNMLQGIAGSLDMMRRRAEQGRTRDLGRYLDAALQSVQRAAALTHRLLAFARRQSLQPKPIDPGALIDGMAALIRHTVGPSIKVELHLSDSIGTLLCDASQLENTLLNLVINARDAMPGGGKLTISTSAIRLQKAKVVDQETGALDDYIEIVVADTGTGIDEATKVRVFEPFFTTKPLGQGTGLGLSQAYGFVRQSGGLVQLDSTLGQGTTVRLFLPRHTSEQEERTQPTVSMPVAPDATGAGEAVLLVEDEAGVRTVTAERLRELGYHVLEAEDGPAALQILSSGTPVDVLVTDVGLPNGLNGRQVADLARESQPSLPVLFITGYARGALDGQLAPNMALIAKPFELDKVAEGIRTLLEAGSGR